MERTSWVRNLLNQDGEGGNERARIWKNLERFSSFFFFLNIYLVVWILVVTQGIFLKSRGIFHCGAWIL